MRKAIAALLVLAGLGAAGILADQAVERDRDYRRLILQGDEALTRGQTFVAIEAYSGAIALKRGSMLAYLKRGEAHQRRGDTPEILSASLRDLRTAADLDPGSTRTLEKLGDVNLQLRRFANAAESYEAYIRLAGRRDGGQANGRGLVGRAVVGAAPGAEAVGGAFQHQAHGGRDRTQQAVVLRDDHSPEVFYKLGLASRGDGRLTRAISALQQAVALNASFHEAHYVLGLCLNDREQIAEARAAFERAIALAPAFIPAREELAELYRLQNRARDELEQLNALFALDPAKSERLIAVGLAHLRAGNRELAVVTLGRAAELFPDTPGVYAALGQVWLEAAEERGDPSDLRKALGALEPVATQTAATSETLGHFGRALVLAGQHARAELVFRQASQRFPTDPDVLPHLAAVAQRLGHLDEARQALVRYSALVDEDRERASQAVRIADLSMALSDAAAAVAWYQKSEALGGSDVALLIRLADAQAKAGQIDEARATAARALQKDPADASARSLARRLQAR